MTTQYRVRVDTYGASETVTVAASVLATRAALVDMARQRAGIDPAVFTGGAVLGPAEPEASLSTVESEPVEADA